MRKQKRLRVRAQARWIAHRRAAAWVRQFLADLNEHCARMPPLPDGVTVTYY
jgi:hypothetical protein